MSNDGILCNFQQVLGPTVRQCHLSFQTPCANTVLPMALMTQLNKTPTTVITHITSTHPYQERPSSSQSTHTPQTKSFSASTIDTSASPNDDQQPHGQKPHRTIICFFSRQIYPLLRATAVQMGLVRAAVLGSSGEIFVGLVKFYMGCMVWGGGRQDGKWQEQGRLDSGARVLGFL